MFRYLLEILIWLDQGLNVVFGPLFNLILKPSYKFGSSDDTISEVLGRNQPDCRFCIWFCKILSWAFREEHHCKNSID
jgi:hypothetical protein